MKYLNMMMCPGVVGRGPVDVRLLQFERLDTGRKRHERGQECGSRCRTCARHRAERRRRVRFRQSPCGIHRRSLKKECTILFLGDDEKTPTAVAATEFILNIHETKTADGTTVAPMTITMSPVDAADGKATTFVGTDPGIGNVADFAGTVSGEIDGKPAMGEFKE